MHPCMYAHTYICMLTNKQTQYLTYLHTYPRNSQWNRLRQTSNMFFYQVLHMATIFICMRAFWPTCQLKTKMESFRRLACIRDQNMHTRLQCAFAMEMCICNKNVHTRSKCAYTIENSCMLDMTAGTEWLKEYEKYKTAAHACLDSWRCSISSCTRLVHTSCEIHMCIHGMMLEFKLHQYSSFRPCGSGLRGRQKTISKSAKSSFTQAT